MQTMFSVLSLDQLGSVNGGNGTPNALMSPEHLPRPRPPMTLEWQPVPGTTSSTGTNNQTKNPYPKECLKGVVSGGIGGFAGGGGLPGAVAGAAAGCAMNVLTTAIDRNL